jgi:hypothetical protein
MNCFDAVVVVVAFHSVWRPSDKQWWPPKALSFSPTIINLQSLLTAQVRSTEPTEKLDIAWNRIRTAAYSERNSRYRVRRDDVMAATREPNQDCKLKHTEPILFPVNTQIPACNYASVTDTERSSWHIKQEFHNSNNDNKSTLGVRIPFPTEKF